MASAPKLERVLSFAGLPKDATKAPPTPPLPPAPPSQNEHHKTFVLILVFFCTYNLNLVCTAIAHELHPSDEGNAPLPDIVLSFTTPRPWAFATSEFCILLNVFLAVTVIFLHASKWVLLRRGLFIYTIVNGYRAITVPATILPNSVRGLACAPRSPEFTPAAIFRSFLRITSACGFRLAGEPRTCGDWIFSGHAATMLWANLLVIEYTPPGLNRFLSWVTTLSTLIGTSLVLASHDHYTIDCIIAYFVVTRVFWSYHALVFQKTESVAHAAPGFAPAGNTSPGLSASGTPTPGNTGLRRLRAKSRELENPIRNVWWVRAFDWAEANVGQRIENRFFWSVERPSPAANGDVKKVL